MQNQSEPRFYILIIKINELLALDLYFHQVLETQSLEELTNFETLVFDSCVPSISHYPKLLIVFHIHFFVLFLFLILIFFPHIYTIFETKNYVIYVTFIYT